MHAALNRYERARVLGSRSLQISMGAPVLVPVAAPVTDPVAVAEAEFDAGVCPITVHRTGRPPRREVVTA